MFKRNLRAALLGSGAVVAMAAVSIPVHADELGDLKAQIDSLQGKLATLEARQTVTESRGTVAPAAVIEAGDRARTFKWAGTDTSVNIGGYAKLDIIYDIGAPLGDSLTVAPPASGSTADNRQGQVRLHARQSRIWIKTWTPTDWGELATHIEGDFFGAGGNQIISNSTSFRIRHAYGRLGPVLAGQTWSNYMCIACLAETIDFSGAYGESFVRAPQLRYTHSFGKGLAVAVSIENPEADIRIAGTGGRQFGAAGPSAFDKAPDGVISATYKHSKGFVRGAIVLRYLSVDSGNAGTVAAPGIAVSDSTFGYGINVGGTWRFDPKNAVGFEFNYGRGIGRYLLVALGSGATCSLGCAANGSGLHAVTAYGGYGWVQHKWTDTIRSNLVTGFARVENDVTRIGAPGANNLISDWLSVHANVIWSPVKQVNFGVEFIFAYTDGVTLRGTNDSERIQVGMQYKF